LKAKLHRRI
jgi:hypothetical protein